MSKKLIEVALPLDAINAESAREKSIRHGHPSTLHLWWARRPLAACRAVLFASLVDDPSALPEQYPTVQAQEARREELFRIIRELVKWENSTNESVLNDARREIARSVARAAGVPLPESADEVRRVLKEHAPPVLDPFCGGGSIPLEAQRLGLEAHGSDLNPVAVLITKALIEIPPRFAGRTPVHPGAQERLGGWPGATGLAEDVRYYGKWMRDEAQQRIGHLYPKVTLSGSAGVSPAIELGSASAAVSPANGSRQDAGAPKDAPKDAANGAPRGAAEATVIAWLWARTVRCPNPACGAQMPLVRSFWLSTKPGKKAWVEPIVDHTARTVRFEVRTGNGAPPGGTVNRQGATCICCGTPVPFDHIRAEGRAGRMDAQMMAIVAEGQRTRVYLAPSAQQEDVAATAHPSWAPETDLPKQALGFRVQLYGMTRHRDLFTPRQLVALTTFSDLVGEVRERVRRDAVAAGLPDDGVALSECGMGATAYADALAIYLGLTPSKAARFNTVLSFWRSDEGKLSRAFGRQTVSMTWDFAETNPFADAGGDLKGLVSGTADVLLRVPAAPSGSVQQVDAANGQLPVKVVLISTDPPYYDNVAYADLSDIFYSWLRHSISKLFPSLFATMLVPKQEELIAEPFRHGSRQRADIFFEEGLSKAFANMRRCQLSEYPLAIYYAFRQEESDDVDLLSRDGIASQESTGKETLRVRASTGWETMLEALLKAQFQIVGTWPVRTEGPTRMRGIGSNALASSIVLVCRPRPEDAERITRREFLAELRRELPDSLRTLQQGRVAPVDLAQAAIGPGMAVYSRYREVLEASGEPMRVRTALQLINTALDEVLSEQEGEFDAATRWAIAWFEQHGMSEGPFGDAETLSKAKNSSVAGMERAGLVNSRGGKVRLLRRDELAGEWAPGHTTCVWELTQRLIQALDKQGEEGAAALLRQAGDAGEVARDLAYRLYLVCERKGWAQEALAYNTLATSWSGLADRAAKRDDGYRQQEMF